MHCPVCKLDLTTTDLGPFGLVIANRCQQCSGTWFDFQQLERLGEDVAAQIAATPAAQGRYAELPCPRCDGAALTSIVPSDARNAVARRCAACGGLWIEPGEAERLSSWGNDESSNVIDRKSLESRPSTWSALRWISWRLRRCFE
jgi:Zn-finger nucleic acid-binding protein